MGSEGLSVGSKSQSVGCEDQSKPTKGRLWSLGAYGGHMYACTLTVSLYSNEHTKAFPRFLRLFSPMESAANDISAL